MKPIEFEGQTTLLAPPPGTKRGDCGALPVIIHKSGPFVVSMSSFWKPSPEDITALNSGAHIRLDVYGGQHPPVWLSVDRCAELP